MSKHSKTKMNKNSKQTYVKMDDIEHVLKRPDMYTGSTRSRTLEEYVVEDDYHIVRKKIKYSPAILRIFIEPLSNVIDNVARSKKAKKPVTKIRVNIDKESGETRFWNDGETIPIEMHETENCYNHTLIFGDLRTSSNYNDEEERYDISGRNGFGVKLCNIFSTSFQVKGVDTESKKSFSQTWTNNMNNVGKPIVKASKLKKGYTEVTYTPDFKQFGIKGYTEDIISLYKKFIIDMAMLTKIPVYYNDELIPVKNLVDYSKLYMAKDSDEVLHIKTKDCEVVLTPSKTHQVISFASGVYTPLGGTHVDAWSEKLFRPIIDKLNKPKKPQISIKDVKQCFRLFVIASVKNPKFESQSKMKLEEPVIEATVKKSHINTIMKWSVIERLQDIIRAKEFVVLKKLERKKRGFTRIPGLEKANKEGGKYGRECTLILVEGKSASSYALDGISVGAFGKKGRDWFGIYPLTGKVLNVRNATATTIANNKIIKDIIQALGLQQNVDYTEEKNYKTLRYGKLLIIADADVDGIHISGLIQNIIHTLFPSLLNREDTFIYMMQTPIVKVFSKPKDLLFYDEREYHKYVHQSKTKIKHKYYKGLGTSDKAMVKETFGKKMIELINDEKSSETMNKVFHKKYTDLRKTWLTEYDSNNVKLTWVGDKHETKQLNISDFIDTELIKFSINDCKRSIPHILDGLKESQRKILYVAFKKNLSYTRNEMKVAQFGAQVALYSGYHHGEQNLFDTIIKMAQRFPGTNNIPLFCDNGKFGTRANSGKDAAAARYIYTKMEMITRLIFHPDDDDLLTYCEDDGDIVEPEYYIPILPMLLVNGAIGIGTAWSCNIPSFNPLDIVNSIKIWLKDRNSSLPELIPWYRGWNGKIIKENEHKYITTGVLEENNKGKIVVSELPIGMGMNCFRDKLDMWKEEKQIKEYDNYSTDIEVNFIIDEHEDGFKCNIENMKLYSYLSTNNMVVFTNEGLRKFSTVNEIIDYYCEKRLLYYTRRKKKLLDKIQSKLTLLGNKKRFMEEVIAGTIKLFKKMENKKSARPTKELVEELRKKKYDEITSDDKEEEDSKDDKHGYSYLLSMQFRSITAEKINILQNDIESAIERENELQSQTESDMYMTDLENFEKQYKPFLKAIIKRELADVTVKKTVKKRRKK